MEEEQGVGSVVAVDTMASMATIATVAAVAAHTTTDIGAIAGLVLTAHQLT